MFEMQAVFFLRMKKNQSQVVYKQNKVESHAPIDFINLWRDKFA